MTFLTTKLLHFRNPLNVLFYSTLYVCLSPLIALKEIAIAGKNSVLTRDLGLFKEIKVEQEPEAKRV